MEFDIAPRSNSVFSFEGELWAIVWNQTIRQCNEFEHEFVLEQPISELELLADVRIGPMS
jgi:hypothetical protein